MNISTQTQIGHITKKEFKELASIHVYGRGERRRVALYFDWKTDRVNNAVGYKYMVKGYGCTQADILRDSYNFLVKNDYTELCWYDTKEAKTDQDRFKVAITG